MPEGLKGADCKSAGVAYVGSNPTRPKYQKTDSLISKKENYLLYIEHGIYYIKK